MGFQFNFYPKKVLPALKQKRSGPSAPTTFIHPHAASLG